MTTIAVLGTGLMGAPMARRLLAAGHRVQVWNRSREKAAPLATEGAVVAASAPEAVAGAAVVITMLTDGAAVHAALFDTGAAAAMAPGTVVIDMSSISPASARAHAALLAERGIRAIDAPVSGGTVGAEQGTLAIMAGGDAAVVAEVSPVLGALGRVTRVGEVGAGQVAKLANQVIVGITIGAVAEALLLAEAGGADPVAVREAIRGGFAESRILDLHGARMLARDFTPRGRSALQLKDLNTILDTARAAGVELPLARQVRDRFSDLVYRLDGGDLDHSGLLVQLEAINAPHVVGGRAKG
jgi:2-hydroxy-3-oxopropionate reductase